jgi:hypothetical protein
MGDSAMLTRTVSCGISIAILFAGLLQGHASGPHSGIPSAHMSQVCLEKQAATCPRAGDSIQTPKVISLRILFAGRRIAANAISSKFGFGENGQTAVLHLSVGGGAEMKTISHSRNLLILRCLAYVFL